MGNRQNINHNVVDSVNHCTIHVGSILKKFAITVSLVTSHAFAGEIIPTEMLCDDTTAIVKQLNEYGEIPVISGKATDEAGSIMTMWTNPQTETWSIVASKNDYSCIVGVGEKLKVIDYKKRKNI